MIALYAVIADLCGSPAEPAVAPDAADSAAYAQVGDDARAAGDVRTAAIAYRKAIALDAANTHAKEALAALCAADAAPTDDAALLAAVARFHAGELDAARDALAVIAAGGGPAAGGAHFFLGLIALRLHDGSRAATELEAARRDPAYVEAATPMVRLARRDGPLAAVVLVEPELDTNPQLLPDTPPPGAITGPPQTDEDLLLLATATARPARWLVLRDVVAWRNQRTLSALDFIGENAQAAIELDERADHLAIRYDLDYDLLAGTRYLIASRGTATYRRDVGDISLTASYALRRRAYQQTAQAPFTGWVHTGELGAILHATPRLDVDLRAVGWRELTADAAFADIAGGVQLAVRARPHERVRVTTSATVWYAHYDGAEPDGARRRDAHGEASADVEVDLGDHVLAVGGGVVARNDSTIDDFRYWKFVARAGIALAFGGP